VTTEEKAAIQANLLRVAREQLTLDAIFSAPFVAEILDAAIAEEREACARAICEGCAEGWPVEAVAGDRVHVVPPERVTAGFGFGTRKACDASPIWTRP
jgi:hypothetical protein